MRNMSKKTIIFGVVLCVLLLGFIIKDVNSIEVAKSHHAKALSTIELNDEVTVKEIDIPSIEDDILRNTFQNPRNSENGVYAFYFSEERKYYILFNSKETSFEDIQFNIQADEITVTYNSKELNTDTTTTQVYVIEAENKDSYDTIVLDNNGKHDSFVDVKILN